METNDHISATVEPIFIKMGDQVLINLNTVKQIVMDKDHVEFYYIDGKEQSFKMKDPTILAGTIANMVQYYQSTE